jgi:hypothetical protein
MKKRFESIRDHLNEELKFGPVKRIAKYFVYAAIPIFILEGRHFFIYIALYFLVLGAYLLYDFFYGPPD